MFHSAELLCCTSTCLFPLLLSIVQMFVCFFLCMELGSVCLPVSASYESQLASLKSQDTCSHKSAVSAYFLKEHIIKERSVPVQGLQESNVMITGNKCVVPLWSLIVLRKVHRYLGPTCCFLFIA